MKTNNFYKPLLTLAAIAGLVLLAGNLLAQDSTIAAQPTAPQPVIANQSAPPLSPGVPEVLQLMQAQVPESTILAFIKNTTTTYRLNAEQIIYLKQQGASNPILDAMITHQPPAVVATPTSNVSTQPAVVSTQPTVTYVQTAPPATVYYAPEPYYYRPAYYAPAYYGYGYYPWVPPVSFSFGYYYGSGHGHGGHGYGGHGYSGHGYGGGHGGGHH